MNVLDDVKRTMLTGWNTWYSNSVTSHVHMSEGIAINLGFKFYNTCSVLREPLIGRQKKNEQDIVEEIHPGARSFDGSYTALTLFCAEHEIKIESACVDDEQYILVTPVKISKKPPALLVSAAILWNNEGYTFRDTHHDGDILTAVTPGKTIHVYTTGEQVNQRNTWLSNPYIAVSLSAPVAVSTRTATVNEAQKLLALQKKQTLGETQHYGEYAEAYNALRTVLAWDTIYEPEQDAPVSTVSRLWNINWGGFVMFDWDNYFAAMMASLDDTPYCRGLAYANALLMTRQATETGFVPNFAGADNYKSRDRSEPPVGSLAVREVYRRYRDKDFVAEVFPGLLAWNRWFAEKRQRADGTLSWGSNAYEPVNGGYWETCHVHDRAGAVLETGQDNHSMYDDATFDGATGLLNIADVALTGLYINDCENCADLANVLGRAGDAAELRARAEKTKAGLETLWDEDFGMYLNRDTVSGKLSRRIGASHFWALYSDKVTPARVERMLREHFYNEDEFYGDWIIPAVPRNDSAFADQDYWRGRIWAPLNYLVYLALRRRSEESAAQARRELAECGVKLLMNEWRTKGHVHENFNGATGEGCDKPNSDRFYHWGALLSLAALTEKGYVAGPEQPLSM